MDKKKLILTIITIILFIVVLILAYMLFNKYVLKNNFESDMTLFAENNEETVFKINKIIFFSSCDAKNKTSSITNFTVENLYQYTDFAIFIDSQSEERTLKNTLKKVTIDNINFNKKPEFRRAKIIF